MMKIFELCNDRNGSTVYVKGNIDSDIFHANLQDFLCNNFEGNKGLTVEKFGEHLSNLGYEVEVIVPDEFFNWWGDSFKTE